MTIICYRDGIMAADRWATIHGVVCGYRTKVQRNRDGALLAVTGGLLDAGTVEGWFQATPGFDHPYSLFPQTLLDKDTDSILALPSGEVRWYSGHNTNQPIIMDDGYHAIGSGFEMAIGALEQGATAIEAALIVCRRVVYCGGGVDWLNHDGNGGRINA